MQVQGFDQTLLYANQLPDPTEPRGHWTPLNFLAHLGRGDWMTSTRTTTPTLLAIALPHERLVGGNRTRPNSGGWSVANRVLRLDVSDCPTSTSFETSFLATLSRRPTAEGLVISLAARAPASSGSATFSGRC